ncbi:Bsd2 protein [Starmerella bacillaris]|uniref:Bsd2 protein n=1 Tax=Starmerella bacillaris TaxID=1247836 RepID=A0AAV5RJ65_STABA|nr:Bsd2 protein [Starmerella bacillaris]
MVAVSYKRVARDQPSSENPEDPLNSAFSHDEDDGSDNSSIITDYRSSEASTALNSSEAANGSSATSNCSADTNNSQDGAESVNSSDTSSSRSRWSGLLNKITGNRAPEVQDEQDGVFGNLVAEEDVNANSENCDVSTNGNSNTGELGEPDEDDDIAPRELPPSYEEASADATPSYWETTIMTSGWDDEIVVGDMPVGSLMAFAWSMLVSSAFSYVGFFITYLFHTSHASRGGSLAGLGLTLMHSSYDLVPAETTPPGEAPSEFEPSQPNNFEDGPPIGNVMHPTGQSVHVQKHKSNHGKFTSNFVFIFGLIIFLKGFWEYLVAFRIQAAILKRMQQDEDSASRAQQEGREAFSTANSTSSAPDCPTEPTTTHTPEVAIVEP